MLLQNGPRRHPIWGALDRKSTAYYRASKAYLVGGAITILENMKVNGKDYPM